ncbi:hypothetical protein MASR1M45_06110 [Candidatus Kapaibacterium sp.]
MKVLIIFIITLILINACSPVRNTTVRKNNSIENEKNKTEFNSKQRFQDTTFIKLPDVKLGEDEPDKSMDVVLNDAIKTFENGDYENSCTKFQSLSSTIDSQSPIYHDIEFYLAECLVIKNQLNEAKKKFEILLSDNEIPDKTLEKVLVRIGQIYCAQDEKKIASTFFSRLENLNPNSIYLKVANCDFLNKK